VGPPSKGDTLKNNPLPVSPQKKTRVNVYANKAHCQKKKVIFEDDLILIFKNNNIKNEVHPPQKKVTLTMT
jgi:hypothetical protein